MTERRQFVGHTSTAESDQFTGLSRELTIDMQTGTIRVHDGTTPGGFPLARADLANISNRTIQSRITNKEEVSNKISVLDENVTHEQYPDARAVYNELLAKANINLDNLNELGRAVIAEIIRQATASVFHAIMPNFANKTQIEGLVFTAPSDGWLLVEWVESGAGTVWVKIDGQFVYGQTTGGNDFGAFHRWGMVPCAKDALINLGRNDAYLNVWFVPAMGY